jgi:hypothetical protein
MPGTRSRPPLPCALLGLLIGGWLGLGLWICFSAPFSSGTDESIRYVAFAAATNGWASAEDAAVHRVDHFYYPPLYFLLFAPFYGDEPAFTSGYPALSGNLALRAAGSTRLVAENDQAAVTPQLLRLYRTAKVLSLCFGVGIVACLVAGVRLVFPRESGPWLALGAGGPLLLLPQFLYFQTLVNNDCLVNLLCALALLAFLAAARCAEDGDPVRAWRWAVLCAVAAGLGLLTKQSAASLLPLLPALVWLRWRGRSHLTRRGRIFDALRHLALLAAVTVAAGGWWVLRSSLAGDPAGLQAQRTTHWWAFAPLGLSPEALGELLVGVARSFIALFAGGYYGIPDRVFALYLLIAAVLLVALAAGALRGRRVVAATAGSLPGAGWAALAAVVLFNLALIVIYNIEVRAPQGRLLFPSLVAIGLRVARSLLIISGGSTRRLALVACALAVSLCALFAWTFRERMVKAVLQPAENLLPLGILPPDGPVSALGPVWGGELQQPLLLTKGTLLGFRLPLQRDTYLPQFGTVLHARLRMTGPMGEVEHDFSSFAIGENDNVDRWTDIELKTPLEIPGMTPALLLLRADKPWLQKPGGNIFYQTVELAGSPLLRPLVINGEPSQVGLAITAVYR